LKYYNRSAASWQYVNAITQPSLMIPETKVGPYTQKAFNMDNCLQVLIDSNYVWAIQKSYQTRIIYKNRATDLWQSILPLYYQWNAYMSMADDGTYIWIVDSNETLNQLDKNALTITPKINSSMTAIIYGWHGIITQGRLMIQRGIL
jgi:hypothetical protein